MKTPSSRQSQWWEQPSPDSPIWWYTTWKWCLGTNNFCEHEKLLFFLTSKLHASWGGERKEKSMSDCFYHYGSFHWSLPSNLFASISRSLKKKTPFNFNARIDIQNFKYKKHTPLSLVIICKFILKRQPHTSKASRSCGSTWNKWIPNHPTAKNLYQIYSGIEKPQWMQTEPTREPVSNNHECQLHFNPTH